MQAPLPNLHQETYVAYQKEKNVVNKRLAESNVKRCVSSNEVVLCKFLIHQHCNLIMKKLKILQHKNENKIKRAHTVTITILDFVS